MKNAVLNSAVGLTLDDVLRGAFFDYLGRFSPLHLEVLELLQDPKSSPAMVAAGRSMGSVWTVLRAAVPQNRASDQVLERVNADLQQSGLIQGASKGMMSAGAALGKQTTDAGDAFLRFISSPLDEA